MSSDVENHRPDQRGRAIPGHDERAVEAPAKGASPQAATGPQTGLGARPIRWGWWGTGLAISLGLWVAIAVALSWV